MQSEACRCFLINFTNTFYETVFQLCVHVKGDNSRVTLERGNLEFSYFASMNKEVIFYGISAKFLHQVESGFTLKAGYASSNSESRILIYRPVKCSVEK